MEQSIEKVKTAYSIIEMKGNSNMFIQGLSGLFGFPFTLIADGATIFTHYGDMLNKIRDLYNRKVVDEELVSGIVSGMSSELLFDIVADKVLGNVPIIGVYFNAICAKTMTWRLGIAFTMLSARGDEINPTSVKKMTKLIRLVFPQNDAFAFKQPSYETFEKLVLSVEENSQAQFENKIIKALEVFDE